MPLWDAEYRAEVAVQQQETMKTWLLAMLFAATVAVAERPPIRDLSEFYEPLSAHGYWVQHERGWCWHPENVAADWRPFATGHWLWTTNGWYWESPEPWAWATYHYGRWFWDERDGWLWLPDLTWVPASTVEARVQAEPPPAPIVQEFSYIERIEPAPIWYFHVESHRYHRTPPSCCRRSPCDRHRARHDHIRRDSSPRERREHSAPIVTPRDQPREERRPPTRVEHPAPPPPREARPTPVPRPTVTEPVTTPKTLSPQAEAYRERLLQRRAEKLAKDRD